ncbi:uncharacterized protein LOC119768845 [Culex quinquefasciatus]|uniref:uncharacterized protein LOC119768845 n=1 Tax=Culex quinquefasciatus TaxID=7176 RepID=UPI0018E3C8DC|nr:uncharacterized protein LOC119768845 [Culex quinquefasciatus]
MSDRDRASPTLIESGLKTLIGGRDSNYPLISGTNGNYTFILNINLEMEPTLKQLIVMQGFVYIVWFIG